MAYNGTPILFLLANWYSGATLLSFLLDRHPYMTCNGETFPFPKDDISQSTCSCGATVQDCEFFSYATRSMQDGDGRIIRDYFAQLPAFSHRRSINRIFNSSSWETFTRRKLIEHLSTKISPQEFVRHQLEFYQRANEFQHAKVYVDGTKSIRRAQLIAAYTDSPIYCIYLIREPHGFANSFLKNQSHTSSIKNIARYWNNYNKKASSFFRMFPSVNGYVLRYEELCRYPFRALNDIERLCGICPRSTLDCSSSFEEAHILGNRMRHAFTDNIREDLSWKTELTRKQKEVVESKCSSDMRKYGYA